MDQPAARHLRRGLAPYAVHVRRVLTKQLSAVRRPIASVLIAQPPAAAPLTSRPHVRPVATARVRRAVRVPRATMNPSLAQV